MRVGEKQLQGLCGEGAVRRPARVQDGAQSNVMQQQLQLRRHDGATALEQCLQTGYRAEKIE
jgi:hypothetical protein